ncbi:SMI1/KNR4 family protein, partial [Nocardiopsis protaetiae]
LCHAVPMETERALDADLDILRAAFAADVRLAPLGWDAVRAFEAEHGITLPEPYRTFVAEIADGSPAGPPYHGLLPLDEVPVGREDTGPLSPGDPFPLTGMWVWEDDDEEPDPETLKTVFNHGSIVLGTDGSGMDWHLVVTGPQRGHVWQLTGEGAGPSGPGSGFTAVEAPGFAGWVDHWARGLPWFE